MFTLDKDELVQAVAPAAAVAPARTPLEQLQNIEIEAKDGTLTVRGSDGNTWIETRLDVDGDLDKSVLPGDFFERVVESLPAGRVKVATVGKRLDLTTEIGRATIPVLGDDGYNRHHPFQPSHGFSIVGSSFKKHSGRVAFAVNTQASSPAFHGMLIRCTPDGLVFAGAHQFAMAEVSITGKIKVKEKIEVIVPLAVIRLVQKHFLDAETVKIDMGASHVVFSTDRLTIAATCIQGPFPPYDAVVQKASDDVKRSVTVDSAVLRDAIRRKQPFVGNREGGVDDRRIRLTLSENELAIEAGDDTGRDSLDRLAVEYAKDDFSVRLNYQNTLSALEGIAGSVLIESGGPKTPVLFSPSPLDEKSTFRAAITITGEPKQQNSEKEKK